jgi:hypothetical protein
MSNGENRTIGAVVVHKPRNPWGDGTGSIFTAYEASSHFGIHSSLMTLDGQVCGKLTTRRIPRDVETLRPGSPERLAACDAFWSACEAESYAAIIAAFPEAASGVKDRGEIVL